MNAVVIEDEIIAAQKLERLIIQSTDEIEVIAILQSVDESIEWFLHNPTPSLVFMDIHLADGSAFSIFDKVQIPCPIIFTTAYDEYALKAFEVNSIDYLLKPISEKSLEHALTKFRNMNVSPRNNSDMMAQLLASINESKKVFKSSFLIPYKDKFIPLAIDKIAFFYSENKMAKITTLDNQSFTIDSSLDVLFTNLDTSKFFRANRQYIVSHKAIKDISVWFGSKLSINLTVSVPEEIIVSKARVPEFKSWYTK
jgi:two-component system, LytTR family, response regulator LytT